MSRLTSKLKYVWVHSVIRLTGILPDLVPILRMRGWLIRPALGSCGRDFQVSSHVVLLSPDHIVVGDNVYLAYGSWIQGYGGVRLGDQVMLGPYTILATSNHTSKDGSFRYGTPDTSPITLRRGSWTGSHVTITAGVDVGEGAACAANSVVTRDVAPGSVVAGVPARVLRPGPGGQPD